MRLFENDFIQIDFWSQDKILHYTWLPDSAKMTDADFRHILEQQMAFVLEHKPDNMLIDSRAFHFIMDEETQKWANRTMFPRYHEASVQKFAFILLPELYEHVKEAYLYEDVSPEGFRTWYFDDPEAARCWLAP